ncbi:glycosyltransferase [Clostridium sp. CX1]|uniref:glycosyltransferase n=1 Tax=Clostridium sp. CX1 TaxID=2978346 RepID=UPI0021C07A4C|nr:glycosyltransferase [Clostridium sp. CX1]MCT8976129.1 glycosyltransferase [Clostridium sp. CX1]
MNNSIDSIKEEIKGNIELLINNNRLEEADSLLNQYLAMVQDDPNAYSMKAVIFIIEGKFDEAKEIIKVGLKYDYDNFDLNYNLAYVCEQNGEIYEAYSYYCKALENCSNHDIRKELEGTINKFKKESDTGLTKPKSKVVFFVKQGMDSFLGDIIKGLSYEYETKKIIVNEYNQIDEGMKWADICWFEWCDELVAYGSKHRLAGEKKILCRLHSYEAFAGYPSNVYWNNVDKIIFVAKHIRDFVIEKFKISKDKTLIIQNGIDLSKYTFKERKSGFNIAYVGYINYKKGPLLLLHAFKAIYDKDHRYKLYIAGQFQDDRDVLYYNQMLREFGLENSVIYEGWQDDLDRWLEDKNYILCTSVLESQNVSVMQAMAKGIKPIVHNFVGAKNIYSEDYVWNTITEAISMIYNGKYSSNEYKEFIAKNYSYENQIKSIKSCVKELKICKEPVEENNQLPLVSICITNYNYSQYIEECILSVIKQTYKNIEVIIIDDCSTDNSREIMNKYKEKYDFIKCIYNKHNKGYLYGIRKFIDSLCKGDYFIILSADDMIAEKDTVEKFLKEHINYQEKFDIIYGDEVIINEKSDFLSYVNIDNLDDRKVVNHTFNSFGSGPFPYLFAMHKTNFYRKNNYSWEKFGEGSNDTLNALIAIKRGVKYKKINYPMFKYRYHTNNMTFNLRSRLKEVLAIIDYIICNFDRKYYMDLKFIGENEEEQKQLDIVFFAGYYYNLIKYYINDYKVYGTWELKLSKKEKLDVLQESINRCKNLLENYKINRYTKFEESISYIRKNLLEICEEI